MKKGLRNLILGASLVLAGAGIAGHKHKQKQDFQTFFSAFKDKVYASYQYKIKPSDETELNEIATFYKLNKMMCKLKIDSIHGYLRDNGLFHISFNDQGVKSHFAGKIVKGPEELEGGVWAYLTKSEDKDDDFEGIKTFQYFRDGVEATSIYHLGSGDKVINIDIAPIEYNAKYIQKKWKLFKQNNEYFKANDSRWDPAKQPVYNIFKDIPESQIADAYKKEMIEASLTHELAHVHGGDERAAYLAELMQSPIVLGDLETLMALENPKQSEIPYKKVAAGILNDLMNCLSVKTKREIYRQSPEQLSEIAERLQNNQSCF